MNKHLNTVFISLAIVIAAYILGHAFMHRNKSAQSISVTGLGSKDYTSDLIVWSGSFSKKNMVLKDAYAELDRDRETIRQYLTSKGVKPNEMVFSSITINKDFSNTYNEDGNITSSYFTGYDLNQHVTIESKAVDKVEKISREVSELINSGVELYSESPEYYYTKLAELKIEMIAEATKDANIRAEKIAENANSDLGKLKSADMGVFQIVAQNSNEDYSWGGSFNTSAKRKTASITVSLQYETD